MRVTSYADISPQSPEWLIDGWIPLAGVTYIAGEGGVGKSFLSADWAARITRGAAMPGDGQEPLPAGSVILVSAEDDPSLSMSWRLLAAGADMSRVYDMTEDFELPASLPALREDMTTIGDVRLIVIDPLADVSSIPITSGAVRIRKMLTNPLRRFASSTGASVVVVHHTTKAGRVAGSAAIMQAARMVLRVAKSAQDERIRLVSVEKSNIADDGAGAIAYTLAGSGLATHVEYLEAPADDVPRREPTAEERVIALLTAQGAPVETQRLGQMLSVPYGAVRTALTRAKQAGLVVSPRRGLWTVPRDGEAPDLAAVRDVSAVTSNK